MKKLIVLLGPPGAGKGTFAATLLSRVDGHRFSTGEIFRRAMHDPEHPSYEIIREAMEQAGYVPDDIAMRVAWDALDAMDSGRLVLDGFPRTLPQGEAFLSELVRRTDTELELVVFLDVPDEVVRQRLLARRFCLRCGSIFNLLFNPPLTTGTCDSCQLPLIQRYDDTEEAIPRRLCDYRKLTEPLVQFFQSSFAGEKTYIAIDGTLCPEHCVQFAVDRIQQPLNSKEN